jgi:predicted acetyltransferase
MTGNTDRVEVLPATSDQETIFGNLLELYIHDFSAFHAIEIGPNGRFGYEHLPLYWAEPHRHPFLARVAGRWAGLILVCQGSRISADVAAWDMAEFFVLRGYRRRNIGTSMAHQVWRRFPGHWEVRVEAANTSAHFFWQHAISSFTGSPVHAVPIEKGGRQWKLYSFVSHP